MPRLRMAQYGTNHGHAAGKLRAMMANDDVECVGVYEPDASQREALATDAHWAGVRWFSDATEMLGDPTIVAIVSEGRNDESLAQTEQIVQAGKHVWYDKPAGDDWPRWQQVVAMALDKGLLIQMGYMFRYHEGFARIAEWARSGFLGRVYGIRAHMSTHIPAAARQVISVHTGGILYDLAGHMLDQIVWMLGRPSQVTSFLRNDSGEVPGFADNTLGVLEYDHAMALVDIAAMEARPMARRFEVYGTEGSAILMEPFEPGETVRLCLESAKGGYGQGVQSLSFAPQHRQVLYERELAAFVATLRGERAPDRPLDHELLVQETLLRTVGVLCDC